MGGAKYQTYTSGDVGWGDSTKTWSAPEIFSGDIGVAIHTNGDGRVAPSAIEWPNGTLTSLLITNGSLGGAWTTGSGLSGTTAPDLGVQTVGMNMSNYQSRSAAIRVTGANKDLFSGGYSYQTIGYGIGGGGEWAHEPAADTITSPFALVFSAYGVQDGTAGVGPNGEQTIFKSGHVGGSAIRGYGNGYTMEGTGADTPNHVWNRGSTAGTWDRAGIYYEIRGLAGGAAGIIIMQFKQFVDELMRGNIPAWKLRERWGYLLGHLPPVGLPVLSATWLNDDGSLGRFDSIETVEMFGFKNKRGEMIATLNPNRLWRDFYVKNIFNNRYARSNKLPQAAFRPI